MVDSPTINSVVFTLGFKDEKKSQRQSVARGINEPDRMIIQRQPYVDSVTKVPGTMHTMKFERHDIDANNEKIISVASVTFRVPSTAVSADYDVLVATFKAAIAHADYVAGLLNSES